MKRRLLAALLAFALLISNVPALGAYADDTGAAEPVAVALTVGEEKTVTDTTGNYADSTPTGLDEAIATATMVGTDASTTLGAATATVTDGGRYMIVNKRGGMAINNASGTWYDKTGLAFSKVDDLDPNAIWTIHTAEGGYTIQDAAGQYIQGGELTAAMGQEPDVLTLSYVDSLWRLSKGDYYLNDAGNDHAAAFFWKEEPYDAPTDPGSQWEIYPVNETPASTAITFRGETVGSTTVTIGSTTYEITVSEKPGHSYTNGFCADGSCDAPYEAATLNGDGVYEIANGGQLYWFAKLVRGGNANASAKLTADITVNPGTFSSTGTYTSAAGESRRSWSPLCSESDPYTGTFDGGEHSISGLWYSNNAEENVGMFACLGAEGTVKDLFVTNSFFNGQTSVGAIVGRNDGGTILRCGNGGFVTSTATKSYHSKEVGGVVGFDEDGTVQDCYNTGTITAMSYVGGVIGYEFGTDATITGCYNTGTVRSTADVSGSNNKYVGGVIGHTKCSVSGCYNTGDITGAACTGGIAGMTTGKPATPITISDCYNTGTVTSNGTYAGAYYIGGIVGDSYGGTTISKCYNAGTVTSTVSHVGGITGGNSKGTTYAVYVENCYNTGSITGTYYVGGIVGDSVMDVSNCYNVGTVHGTDAKQAYVGGVVGVQNQNRELTNCYYLPGCATDGNHTVQNGIGQKALGETTADVESVTTAKTTEQFASGEVTYLLNGSTSEGTEEVPLVWFQTVGQGTPDFTGKTVYFRDGAYTNENTSHVHTFDQEVVADQYLKKPATCRVQATYYKSCTCGEKGTDSDTFKSGELAACQFDANGFCPAFIYHYQEPEVVDGVYQIANGGNLYWFSTFVNGRTQISGEDTPDDTSDDVYSNQVDAVLTQDITINTQVPDSWLDEDEDDPDYIERSWQEINSFGGIFDGQGHTISGLYYHEPSSLGFNVGLFSSLSKTGVVRNVNLANSYIGAGRCVGGIVGYNHGGRVENCTSSAYIYGSSSNIGGIVGFNGPALNSASLPVDAEYGVVVGCTHSGTIYGEGNNTGGIVGNNTGLVERCVNTGSIEVDGSSGTKVGGIVGTNDNRYAVVEDCYNTGSVIADKAQAVGGIAGSADGSYITNCHNYGTVSGLYYAGGILGRGYNPFTVKNCYYLTGCATDDKNVVQNGVGYKAKGSTTADVAGKTTAKTAEQFASGEVTYLLNGSKSEGELVWKQTLTVDTYPKFEGKTVYFDDQNGTYYNERAAHTHDFAETWSYDATSHWHACSGCDEKQGEAVHTGGTATCTAKAVCSVCEQEYGQLADHVFNQEVVGASHLKSAATCTAKAVYYKSCSCGENGTETFEFGDVDATNHTGTLGEWQKDEEKHWKEYSCCHAHAEEAAHKDENTDYLCDDCAYQLPQPAADTVIRLEGQHRHETSLKTADEMKEVLGVEKFDTIIVADGYEFYDALSGSYLAAVKKAPILLSYSGDDKYAYLNDNNLDYIKANLAENGTVYILGGENAVPTLYDDLKEYTEKKIEVKRLGGDTRFDTNLLILEEAGIPAGSEILVCTSSSFADSLSAAATGKPILLVWNERGDLYGNQATFLSGLENCTFTIIGGEGAVRKEFVDVLRGYGEVERLAGGNRLQTSVAVAEKYFQNVDQAVLAYAWEFPDGLCGGSLAYAMKAPLILTMTGMESAAVDYAAENGITSGIVLGGAARISDASVREIFAMAEDAEITVK